MSYGLSTRFSFALRLPWAQEPGGAKTDTSLRAEVVDALQHCNSLKNDRIRVRVRDHVVYLMGMVGSWENRRLAGDAAWSIDGIDEVINYLKINV